MKNVIKFMTNKWPIKINILNVINAPMNIATKLKVIFTPIMEITLAKMKTRKITF